MNAITATVWGEESPGATSMLSGAPLTQPYPGASMRAGGDHPMAFSDVWIRSRIVEALRTEPWIAVDFVGISVAGGVVRLSGEIDDVHGVLALRRIAAATPGVSAIVDDLWVSYE